jgi:hypothetical protein
MKKRHRVGCSGSAHEVRGKRRTATTYPELRGTAAIYHLRHVVGGAVRRIGQTIDLNGRQAGHWGEYTYYTFRRAPVRSLNRLECLAWHRHGGERGELDGKHPPLPASGCPVPGCRLNNRP